MKIAVILPAAGSGTRFNPSQSGQKQAGKIELDLHGRPVFIRCIELFLKRPEVSGVFLAVNPDTIDDFRFRWGDRLGFLGVNVIAGGRAERWETVLNALKQIDESCTHIAVHDAVRPLASKELVSRVFSAAEKYEAVIPGLPVVSTLKRIDPDATDTERNDPIDAILGGDVGFRLIGQVMQTVGRNNLIEVQTPQIFEAKLLRRAYEQIESGKLDADGITDDASLIESLGHPVRVVDGESTNIKITRPEDAEIAEAIVTRRDQSQAKELAKKRLFGDDDD